jgi:hypothetical protein
MLPVLSDVILIYYYWYFRRHYGRFTLKIGPDIRDGFISAN